MATLLREPVAGIEPAPQDWQSPPPPSVTPTVPPAAHFVPRQPPGRARRALRLTVLGAALLLAGIVGGGLLAVSWAPFGDTAKLVTDTFNWVAVMLQRSPAVRPAEPPTGALPAPPSAPAARLGQEAAPPPAQPPARAYVEPPPAPAPAPASSVDRAAEAQVTRPQFERMLSPPSSASAPPPALPGAPPAEAAPKFAPTTPAGTASPAPVQAPPTAAQPPPPQPQAQAPASQPLYPWGTVPYYGRPAGY
jgi:hypothetical protein